MLQLESALLALAVLLRGTAAQCDLEPGVSSLVDAFSKIGSDASSVANNVNGFAASQGLESALQIQSGYDTISADVATATSLVQGLSSGLPDCQQSAIGSQFLGMAPQVVGLLQALSSKAPDFSSVGAQDIVQGDLTNLQPGVNTIEEQAYSKLACGQINSIYPSISAINDNFAAALSVYGGAVANPPASPTSCANDASSSSAAASSGAEPTFSASLPILTSSSNISMTVSQPGSSQASASATEPGSTQPASSQPATSSTPSVTSVTSVSASQNVNSTATSSTSPTSPTYTCIAPGSPAAKYFEALMNFDSEFGHVAVPGPTWDDLPEVFPPLTETLAVANSAGRDVGMLSGCEAEEMAERVHNLMSSLHKAAYRVWYGLNAAGPPDSSSNGRRRKRATIDEVVADLQREAVGIPPVLASMLPCDLFKSINFDQVLNDIYDIATLAGVTPVPYDYACVDPTSTAATSSPSTGTAASTSASTSSGSSPTFTCIAAGSVAAKFIENVMTFEDRFTDAAMYATWDTLQDDLPVASDALNTATSTGKDVGKLSGCEAQELSDYVGSELYSIEKLASRMYNLLNDAGGPDNSSSDARRRVKRATDAEALEQFQNEAVAFADVMFNILPSCDLYGNARVGSLLDDAEMLASLADIPPPEYNNACDHPTSSTPAPGPTNSTGVATSTPATKTTITTTYVTTCPVCTGTHVESGTTITDATTVTTTYCPEDTTPGVPGPTSAVYTTTYITTCPVTEGSSVVTKPTTITTVITDHPPGQSPPPAQTTVITDLPPGQSPPPAQTTVITDHPPGQSPPPVQTTGVTATTAPPVQTGGSGTMSSSIFGTVAAVLLSALL